MAFRDLIPWTKNQELAPTRDSFDPFLTLHREMNRLFDDVFRGFDLSPFGSDRFFDRITAIGPASKSAKPIRRLKSPPSYPAWTRRTSRSSWRMDTCAIHAYLGHRNIQNTTRYTALAPQSFKEFFCD